MRKIKRLALPSAVVGVLLWSSMPSCVRAEPDDVAPPAQSSRLEAEARFQRQKIITAFDQLAEKARREHHISVNKLPVLSRCADLKAAVSDCQAASDQATQELNGRIEAAKKAEQEKALTPTPVTQNVTIYVRPPRPPTPKPTPKK